MTYCTRSWRACSLSFAVLGFSDLSNASPRLDASSVENDEFNVSMVHAHCFELNYCARLWPLPMKPFWSSTDPIGDANVLHFCALYLLLQQCLSAGADFQRMVCRLQGAHWTYFRLPAACIHMFASFILLLQSRVGFNCLPSGLAWVPWATYNEAPLIITGKRLWNGLQLLKPLPQGFRSLLELFWSIPFLS